MRKLLMAAFFCAVAGQAWAGQVIATPVLGSVANFRDVAGPGAAEGGSGQADAAAGGSLRVGQVYRANALTLSPADAAVVARLGVVEDIDLRTPYEEVKTPDVVPPGAVRVSANIFGTPAPVFPPSHSAAAAQAQMENIYRNFVTSPVDRAGFRAAVLDVAYAHGPVLFHCSAGKDRTGWLAAILQSIAGVSQADIYRDYLASNAYEAKVTAAQLAKMPAAQRAVYAPLLGVQRDYLDTSFAAVEQNYGSMEGYITKGLGLTPAQIAAVKQKLVEE